MGIELEQRLNSLYLTLRTEFQTHFMALQDKIKKLGCQREYEQASSGEN